MNQKEFEELAELFKIFGTPTRLQIMYALVNKEKCVYDIAEELGMSQSAISHQLSILKQNRLVKNRRDGKKRIAGIALMAVGIALFLLCVLSSLTIWWG